MTPSAMLSSGSPSTSSSSTDMLVPRPVQAGQAPKGALNEKVRGSISVSETGWRLGQLRFSLKVCVRSRPPASSST